MTLSTPLLWVFLPIAIALIVLVFSKRKVFGIILTSLTGFGLALLANFFPENMVLSIGPLNLIFKESLAIFGREVTIAYEILPFIALIFSMTGLWALFSGLPNVPLTFRPISLVITSLLAASFGVEPFLYAALLIETAVLLSIPMLSPMGKLPHSGVLRYLTLQTLAMPFILLAGWLLTGVEALPPESPLILQSALVLGIGLALLLAVFPFHSWVPMLSQRSNPLVASFILFIMPTTILLFSLNFLNRYPFLRDTEMLFSTLRIVGALLIAISGVWTAVQTDLKRALGFAVLTETGFSLLAIGLAAEGGLTWMLMLFPVRGFSFWLWGTLLTRMESYNSDLTLPGIQGFARRYPVFSFALVLVQFSVAGMPLLGEFPIKLSLLTTAYGVNSAIGIWSFIGSLGLLLFSLRLLLTLVTPKKDDPALKWSHSETLGEYLPILVMVLFMLAVGIFPNFFLSKIAETLTVFGQLQ
jgi:NADH:ubiquinone oxidoreductase subunit 2 (subunit N)